MSHVIAVVVGFVLGVGVLYLFMQAFNLTVIPKAAVDAMLAEPVDTGPSYADLIQRMGEDPVTPGEAAQYQEFAAPDSYDKQIDDLVKSGRIRGTRRDPSEVPDPLEEV